MVKAHFKVLLRIVGTGIAIAAAAIAVMATLFFLVFGTAYLLHCHGTDLFK